MKYNLAIHALAEANTTIGNVDLTTNQIIDILNNQASITVTSGDIVCIDVDLGLRIATDEIRYYFDSTVSGTVASNVEFYYKEESFESYDLLNTYIASSYFYTVVSGSEAPRYLRIKHAATTSGTLRGYIIYNDDTVVDFGTDGTRAQENIEASLRYSEPDIRTVAIYNSGNILADAYCMLEPQGDVSDDVLSIASSEDGPWYSPRQTENKIAGAGYWDAGVFNNTYVENNNLKLSSGYTSGTYTTRIFDTLSYGKYTHINMEVTYPYSGSLVATTSGDNIETFEIRSSNTAPLPYDSYLAPYFDGSEILLKEFWANSESPTPATEGRFTEATRDVTPPVQAFRGYIDETDHSVVTLMVAEPVDWGTTLQTPWFIVQRHRPRSQGWSPAVINNSNYYILWTDDDSYSYRSYKPYIYALYKNSYNGIWFYLYHNKYYQYNNSPRLTSTGYYLYYMNSNLMQGVQLRKYSSTGFIYDMDQIYDTTEIWYTDTSVNAVIRLDPTDTINASYDATEALRGIVTAADNGCFFIQGNSAFKLNYDGDLEYEIDIQDDDLLEPSRIAIDKYNSANDMLWITDDRRILHVFLDGRVAFALTLDQQPVEIWPTARGVLAKCTDNIWRYIDRDLQAVYSTIDRREVSETSGWYNNAEFALDILPLSIPATSIYFGDWFPIADDSVWQALEWNKVTANEYNLPDEDYHQIRLTLRAESSSESPLVQGLYLQEAVLLENIYPGQYENLYLKTDVSGQSSSGSYTSNLKTWWYIPD